MNVYRIILTGLVSAALASPIACALVPPPVDPLPTKPPPVDQAETAEDEDADAQDEKTIALRAKTWTLHARAVAHRVKLSEDATETLAETYVKHRQQLEELIQEMRQEWIADLERQIERLRASNQPIPPSIYDRSELNANIFTSTQKARTKLAEAIVEIMERPQAEKAFPALAAFDRRVDTMIGKLAEFELEDDKAFPVIDTIDLYFEETQIQRNRRYADERARVRAVREVRAELIRRITPHLTAEQLTEFKNYLGVR